MYPPLYKSTENQPKCLRKRVREAEKRLKKILDNVTRYLDGESNEPNITKRK